MSPKKKKQPPAQRIASKPKPESCYEVKKTLLIQGPAKKLSELHSLVQTEAQVAYDNVVASHGFKVIWSQTKASVMAPLRGEFGFEEVE